jgi:hypothetical protein
MDGGGRYTFFGRCSKNLLIYCVTYPASYSKSMFSQMSASVLQVRCIMSPLSIILIGDLFVWK